MDYSPIVQTVRNVYPNIQALYLFGSYGTEYEWSESDVDLAMLLSPVEAKQANLFLIHELGYALEKILNKSVDLINLRTVSTVLQKEVVIAERRIYVGNLFAAEEFEMLVFSYYQKLNEERAEIIDSAMAEGRFFDV